jgi:hypothetical protein
MKQFLVLLACAASLGILSGCSDDDCTPCSVPPVADQPLAIFSDHGGGSIYAGFDSVRIVCSYWSTTDTLYDIFIDAPDDGKTFTIDESNNPDFNEAVAILTNGLDDDMHFWMLWPSGEGSGAPGTESYFLNGGLSREWYPDLAGAEVTKILLHVDYFTIDNQVTFTEYELKYRVVFMGRP